MGCVLAGGVPPWAVSPLVVFPPAVFAGCAPSGSFVARSSLAFMCCVISDVSGVPVPGRLPGHQQNLYASNGGLSKIDVPTTVFACSS